MVVVIGCALGVPSVANAATPDDCAWRSTAQDLARSLQNQTDQVAQQLQQILQNSGITATGSLPQQCGGNGTSGSGGGSGTSGGSGTNTATGNPAGSDGATNGSGAGGNCAATAGAAQGWGTPNREDDFTDPATVKNWGMYDGPGHAGNGRRTPTAASILGGLLTITGDAQGNSEGMAWNPGQKYGRWEGCVKSPPGADSLHSLLLLWPDSENWPVGGEVDFMEISDPARQSVDGFLHYGADNSQETASTKVDATQWHAWAVEWTPQHIAYYVDGKQWFETTDTSHLPPGPMHLTIQLDYFGGDASGGAKEIVNWVRQYPLNSSGGSSSGGSAGAGSGSSSAGSSSAANTAAASNSAAGG